MVTKRKVDSFIKKGGVIVGNTPEDKIRKLPKPKVIRKPRVRKSPISNKVRRRTTPIRQRDPFETISAGFGGF